MSTASNILHPHFHHIRMKNQCRGSYTSKIEGMLNDFMIADVLDKDFEQDFLVWKTFVKDPKLVI